MESGGIGCLANNIFAATLICQHHQPSSLAYITISTIITIITISVEFWKAVEWALGCATTSALLPAGS